MLLPDLCLRNKTRGSLCPALVREDPLKLTAWAGVPLELYFEKEKWRGIPTTKKNHNLDTTVAEHGPSLIQ